MQAALKVDFDADIAAMFDRLLVAVSQTEAVPLLTADGSLSRYGPGIRVVA